MAVSSFGDDFHAATSDAPIAADGPIDGKASSSPLEEPGVANLDRVRDILFGAHMRDYDRRFARLEERLVKETTTLNDEVRRRLTVLEEFVKREAESLAERI